MMSYPPPCTLPPQCLVNVVYTNDVIPPAMHPTPTVPGVYILMMSYPPPCTLPPQCLEKVTFLHLGFNKLRVIPRFASKAKYTLTVLNLRNNQLDTIEGGRGMGCG